MAYTTKLNLDLQAKAGSITNTLFSTGCVDSSVLAANAVTSGKIAANAVVASNITAGVIAGTHIASGAIPASCLSFSPLTSDNLIFSEELTIASSGATSVVASNTPLADKHTIKLNGIDLVPTTEYTMTGKTAHFTFSLDGSEKLLIDYMK